MNAVQISIRPIVESDIKALKEVLDTIDLFPSEYLDEMIRDAFTNPNSQDIWFTATQNDIPISIGYCAPEKFTEGTFNLYAIGIHKSLQRQGLGQKMMSYIEEQLKSMGSRILIVETSGTEALSGTRKFYKKIGYTKEAVIRGFWGPGDDKVVFWKYLC